MFILSESFFQMIHLNGMKFYLLLRRRIRKIKQTKLYTKFIIFRRISISSNNYQLQNKIFAKWNIFHIFHITWISNARVVLQQWKANIIKTKFQKILFTSCNNVVNIALNQISFDDKGFGMDTDKRDPFFPCISHLCKFLAELTFEDHPSAWSRDHIDSNIST